MMSSQLIFKYFETLLLVLKIVSVISYNNDDNRWRIAKRLKFGVKIIREVGYISNVLTYIKVQLYKRTSKKLTS